MAVCKVSVLRDRAAACLSMLRTCMRTRARGEDALATATAVHCEYLPSYTERGSCANASENRATRKLCNYYVARHESMPPSVFKKENKK